MRFPEIFVTSDTHFGHKNIIKYEDRPFTDTEEMDEALIDNWNSVVKPTDLIIHVGDLTFHGAKKAEELMKRLNGRKILVKGNHDYFSKTKYANMGFDLRNYLYMDDFLFSHYPMQSAMLRVAQEYTDFQANIHGHVHGMTEGLDRRVHVCVCTEHTNYTPINFSDLKYKFKRGYYIEKGKLEKIYK